MEDEITRVQWSDRPRDGQPLLLYPSNIAECLNVPNLAPTVPTQLNDMRREAEYQR